MRIAVTGASGFIGSELLAYIADRPDIEITALTRSASDRPDTSRCTWRTTDYSEESLAGVLEGADAVIHLAGVRGTTSDPDDYVINEVMTARLLRAMSVCGAKRIVFASTISVYDDVDTIPWKEDGPLRGRTMYGESKIRCEELIRSFAEETGCTFGIVRIAQVLGAGEKRRGMMNVFIDTAAAGGELKVIGRSEAKRQYLYVRDLAEILTALACGVPDNITVNAGMPHAYSNLEIAETVNKVYGNSTPVNYDDSAPETIRPSCMDISRLRDVLHFEPLDMEDALADMKNEAEHR